MNEDIRPLKVVMLSTPKKLAGTIAVLTGKTVYSSYGVGLAQVAYLGSLGEVMYKLTHVKNVRELGVMHLAHPVQVQTLKNAEEYAKALLGSGNIPVSKKEEAGQLRGHDISGVFLDEAYKLTSYQEKLIDEIRERISSIKGNIEFNTITGTTRKPKTAADKRREIRRKLLWG